MSIGVNVLAKIVAEVAAILPDFDAEVIEIHHRTKIDAPSGTALSLGKAIASARGARLRVERDLRPRRNHGRQARRQDCGARDTRGRRGRRSHGDFRRAGRAPRADPSRAKPRLARPRRTPRGGLAGRPASRASTQCATSSEFNLLSGSPSTSEGAKQIRFPFPLGKGLGVRFFASFATPSPQQRTAARFSETRNRLRLREAVRGPSSGRDAPVVRMTDGRSRCSLRLRRRTRLGLLASIRRTDALKM